MESDITFLAEHIPDKLNVTADQESQMRGETRPESLYQTMGLLGRSPGYLPNSPVNELKGTYRDYREKKQVQILVYA